MSAPHEPLDRIDFEILAALQNNARLRNKALAAHVGLAPSTMHERVKRLWASGVVTGARAEIDFAKIGFGLSAVFFVTLSKTGALSIDALMAAMASAPEIEDVYLVTGRYDLVVTVVARDMDHLKAIAYDQLTARDGVERYETAIAYERRRGAGVLRLEP